MGCERSVMRCERSVVVMILQLDYLVYSFGNCAITLSTEIGLRKLAG